MYCGPVAECEQFFRKLESHLPAVPIVNVADYIIEATSRLTLSQESSNMNKPLLCPSVTDLAEGVARHCDQLMAEQDLTSEAEESEDPEPMSKWIRGNGHLAAVLLRRDFVKESRRARYWTLHFSRCVALGLFLGNVAVT